MHAYAIFHGRQAGGTRAGGTRTGRGPVSIGRGVSGGLVMSDDLAGSGVCFDPAHSCAFPGFLLGIHISNDQD
jgi:hypothetical protein